MRLGSQKYSVAWFKLAECISRGEREKALGVYRLLSHSIEDQACALQLEGAILEAFNDRAAQYKYEQAAGIYRVQGRLLLATALYRQLQEYKPQHEPYSEILFELHKAQSQYPQAASFGIHILNNAVQNKDGIRIVLWLENIASIEQLTFTAAARAVLTIIEVRGANAATIEHWLSYCVDHAQDSQKQELQQWMASLQEISPKYYQKACDLIERER